MSAPVGRPTDPEQMVTGEGVLLGVRSTGFLLRAAGAMIDVAVSIAAALISFFALIQVASALQLDPAALQAGSVVIIVATTIMMPALIEAATHGRSLGRFAVGARIVRDDGGAAGFRHALLRALTGFFEIYMTMGGGAALVGLLSSRAKRIGDMLAGTYSQHERVPRPPRTWRLVPPELSEWAAIADVARMPDRLSRRVSQFLEQAPRLTDSSRRRLGQDLAAEASSYVSPLPTCDPVTFLHAVAAVRSQRSYRALMIRQEHLERLDSVLRAAPHGFPVR